MADDLTDPNVTGHTDAEVPDFAMFELWVVDYSNHKHLVTSTEGDRASALLEIINDLTQYATMGKRPARDFFVCEVVRIPVDLSHMGKVQQ